MAKGWHGQIPRHRDAARRSAKTRKKRKKGKPKITSERSPRFYVVRDNITGEFKGYSTKPR